MLSANSARVSKKSANGRLQIQRAAFEALEARRLFSGALLPNLPPNTSFGDPQITFDSRIGSNGVLLPGVHYSPSSTQFTFNAPLASITYGDPSKGLILFNTISGQTSDQLQLQMKVNPADGSLIPDAATTNLQLTGWIDLNGNGSVDAGEPSGDLLSAQLTAFGYDFPAAVQNGYDMNFQFSVTGGVLAPYFQGQDFGMTMVLTDLSSLPSFASGLSGNGQGTLGPLLGTINGTVNCDTDLSGTTTSGDVGEGPSTLSLTGVDAGGAPITFYTDAGGNPLVTPASSIQIITNNDGTYSIGSLTPGTYTLSLTSATPGHELEQTHTDSYGHTVVVNNTRIITVGSDDISSNNDFYQIDRSSISGTAYVDANDNGTKNPSETAVQGVVVTLTGTDYLGHAVAPPSQTSDATGAYAFGNLLPGTYAVTEGILPAGYLAGKQASNGPIAVTGCDNGEINKDVGIVVPAFISGFVFCDNNLNGSFDSAISTGDEGLPGATLQLTGTDDQNHAVTLTTVSAADGSYIFPNLRPGTYSVASTSQPLNHNIAPYYNGAPNTNFALVAGTAGTGHNVAEISPSSISGIVFLDSNNNGVQDAGEAGIGGVMVTLTGTDLTGLPVSLTTTTGADGSYAFIGVPPSTNAGYAIAPHGYLPGMSTPGIDAAGIVYGTAGQDVISNVTLGGCGVDVKHANFGFLLPATISGIVYCDSDLSKTLTAGDEGLGGELVTLTGTDDLGNTVSLPAQPTDANGNYSFTGLRPGIYSVTLTQTDPTHVAEFPGNTGSVVNIAIGSGGTVIVNFADVQLGSISGTVINSVSNGGIATLLTLSGTDYTGQAIPAQSTTSDAVTGAYSFAGLLPGHYTVTESEPAGYHEGTNSAGNFASLGGTDQINVALPACENNSIGDNFGELPPANPALVTTASPAVTLGTTAPTLTDTATLSGGFSPTGTITFKLYNGSNVLVDTETTTVSGNGTYATPTGYGSGAAGTYTWKAVYSGDANNNGANDQGGLAEQTRVSPASPAINTVPGPTVVIGSGAKLTDTAVLSGGYLETGTVTFTLYNGATVVDTETVAASGNGTYVTPAGYLPTAAGTYQWVASYSGDANNIAVSGAKGDEPETVSPASPALVTTPGIVNAPGCVAPGQFATIGFWHNQNGQAVINAMTGATTLGNWLANTFPKLFGSSNILYPSVGSLAGKTNAQVAAAYGGLWTPSGLNKNTYVQAFAVALGVYADTTSLGGQSLVNNGMAAQYGFVVTAGGAGTFNVGSNGAAFGVANNTSLSVAQILAIVNNNFDPVTGNFYVGDQTKTSAANNVLDGINTTGDIPGNASTLLGNGFKLTDSATLSGGYQETGSLTFYLMGPGSTASTPLTSAVDTEIVTVSGNGTYNTPNGYLPGATGTYQWVVVYGGDGNNNAIVSPFGSEPYVVGSAIPTIVTNAGPAVVIGSGAKLTDSATLTGGMNFAGGDTVTFKLFAPGNSTTPVYTDVVTISGNGTFDTSTGSNPGGYVPTTVGTYQWLAVFSGDANNSSASDNFGDEPEVVNKASPTLMTTASYSVGNVVGSAIPQDSAVLSGGYLDSGTITFTLKAPDGVTVVDTETVTVTGNGTYTTANTHVATQVGTYKWTAVYNGDTLNNGAHDQGGAAEQVIVVAGSTITGTVFCDNNLNGIYESSGSGDTLDGGAVVTLTNTSTHATFTATTGVNGSFSIAGLPAGTYTLVLTTPSAGHTAELPHGTVNPPQIYTITVGTNSTGYNFAEVDYGSISGLVFLDINDSGNFDTGDVGIAGATVKLSGYDYLGNPVSKSLTTDSTGKFSFIGLLPSSSTGYTTVVTPPAGDLNGTDTVGTLNGLRDGFWQGCGSGTIACIVLPGCNNDAINYKFGELGIFHGLTATIGFWHNQNGQALLKSFGNTSNGLSLANWLATTLPNLFGKNAPAFNVASTTGTNLTNRSNTDVAAYFLSLFGVSGQKSYAQVLSTAFAVFTTTNSLDAGSASRALALKYGFILSNSGGGAATFAVPQADWAAFGITSSASATKTIIQLLLAANNNAVAGKLNGGNTTLINETNDVFNTVNNRGDIGTGMALVTSESGAYTLMTDSLGHVFAGTYLVQIDPSFSADQVARIEDAINNLDLSLSKYGVVLAEMPQGISASPDIDIHYSTTSSIGGMADGVLGVTELGGHITIINGWNYYLSGDPSGVIGSGQYDFQTVVTHELGHSLGLGHSTDTNSVMYPALSTGEARRSLTSYDLSMLDNDVEPAAALHAVVPRSVKLANDRTKLTDARQHLLKDKARLKATKHADERAYHAALHQYHLALRTAAHKHSAPSASIADLTAEVRRLRDAVLNDRSAIVTTTRADLAAIRNARQVLAAGQAAK